MSYGVSLLDFIYVQFKGQDSGKIANRGLHNSLA